MGDDVERMETVGGQLTVGAAKEVGLVAYACCRAEGDWTGCHAFDVHRDPRGSLEIECPEFVSEHALVDLASVDEQPVAREARAARAARRGRLAYHLGLLPAHLFDVYRVHSVQGMCLGRGACQAAKEDERAAVGDDRGVREGLGFGATVDAWHEPLDHRRHKRLDRDRRKGRSGDGLAVEIHVDLVPPLASVQEAHEVRAVAVIDDLRRCIRLRLPQLLLRQRVGPRHAHVELCAAVARHVAIRVARLEHEEVRLPLERVGDARARHDDLARRRALHHQPLGRALGARYRRLLHLVRLQQRKNLLAVG